jgi:hypothetical protein
MSSVSSVLNSTQERQRLMTRLDYLIRQYETLGAVSHLLSEIIGAPAPVQLSETDLLSQLEEQGRLIENGDVGPPRRALGQIGGALYEIQEQLHHFDQQISVYQMRKRFHTSDASRDEIGSLLQFMLSKLNFTEEDFEKVDYLTTRFYSLSIRAGGGFSFENMVRFEYQRMLDYAGITKMETLDPEGLENIDFFRDEIASASSLQQLASNETLDRFRAFKAGLQKRRLHPEVMVELARVNLLAGERFEQIAQQAREHINELATKLLSAGIIEAEELKDVQTTLIEEVLKIALRDASQLNDDYKNNRSRIERLARANEALSRASERLGSETAPAPAESAEAPLSDLALPPAPVQAAEKPEAVETTAAPETEIALTLPTPETFRQGLSERLGQMTTLLNHQPASDPSSDTTVELTLAHSKITLSAWEAAAFQQNHPRLSCGPNSLGALLRLSAALMAELKEQQQLIEQLGRQPRLRQNLSGSLSYLSLFGAELLRELESYSDSFDPSLSPAICHQLQQTQKRLADACSQFSAKVRQALS